MRHFFFLSCLLMARSFLLLAFIDCVPLLTLLRYFENLRLNFALSIKIVGNHTKLS
jgi:hypothetical protein